MLFLLCSLLHAKQLDYHLEKASTEWSFSYDWKDAKKARNHAEFQLPATAMEADQAIPVNPRMQQLLDVEVQAAQDYGATLKGIKLKAWKEDNGIRMSVSSKTKSRKALKAALDGANDAVEAAADQWLAANGYMRVDENTIMVDYTRIVAEYVDDVAPVAAALGAGSVVPTEEASVREYLVRALSFVQNIPFEARNKKGGDAGFRRPLSLLARNKGDCDGKSALFLALVRAALPDVKAGIVIIPGHAFVAVAIPPRKGDTTFKQDGVKYVAMEPVGPAVVRVGKVSSSSASRIRTGGYTFKPIP